MGIHLRIGVEVSLVVVVAVVVVVVVVVAAVVVVAVLEALAAETAFGRRSEAAVCAWTTNCGGGYCGCLGAACS